MQYYNLSMRPQDPPMWIDDQTWVCRRHAPAARYSAAVSHCLLGCATERPTAVAAAQQPPPSTPPVVSDVLVKKKAPSAVWKDLSRPWGPLIDADEATLRAARIMDLRAYARHHLGMVGISKVRGGKEVIVPMILLARQTR